MSSNAKSWEIYLLVQLNPCTFGNRISAVVVLSVELYGITIVKLDFLFLSKNS